MLIYGLMKMVEKAPSRYDALIRLLTFNRIGEAHRRIVSEAKEGSHVLDVGCGTGNVSMLCAQSGAQVTAVDSSKAMLSIFRQRIDRSECRDRISIHECGAASMDGVIRGQAFDLVVICLVLGELPAAVRRRTLEIASQHLREDGRIVICDELWPRNRLLSLLYHVLFAAFLVPNFLLTRTLIRPVRDMAKLVQTCGLRVVKRERLFLNAISILHLKKD